MRPVHIAGAAMVAAVLVATGTGAEARTAKHFTCTIQLQTLAVPGTSGAEEFGTVACDRVFGKGVEHDPEVTLTPTTPTTGTGTGPYKQYFNKGTIRGKFTLAYTITPPAAATFTGTATISGGTGAYKHVRGSAKLTCNTADGGTHTTCTEEVTLTHT